MSRERKLHPKPAVTLDEIKPELARLSRRGLLTRGLSLGSLVMLTGCDLSTHSGVDGALWKIHALRRLGASAAVLSSASREDLSGERGDQALPLQCLLRGVAGSGDALGLAARIVWPDR